MLMKTTQATSNKQQATRTSNKQQASSIKQQASRTCHKQQATNNNRPNLPLWPIGNPSIHPVSSDRYCHPPTRTIQSDQCRHNRVNPNTCGLFGSIEQSFQTCRGVRPTNTCLYGHPRPHSKWKRYHVHGIPTKRTIHS